MERFCEYARTLVPLIRRCFCGDEEDDSQVPDLGSGVTQVHTVISELSPVTRDIISAGLVPELRDESEARGRGDESILGDSHSSERGPVLVHNFVEGRLTTLSSVDEEDDTVRPFVTSPNVSWFGQINVTAESSAIVDLTAEEDGSCTIAQEGSEAVQQERVVVNVGDPEHESEPDHVNNYFKVTTWFCIVPHDITRGSKIGSKWGIVQKAVFFALVGLALLNPLSYLKSTYMETNSRKTDVVHYASYATQLVTVSTYIVTLTCSSGELRNFFDSLTGGHYIPEISSLYATLPVSAMFMASFAALFEGAIGDLSKWAFEEELDFQAFYMKEFFLQWSTGNGTEDVSDKWIALDTAFGITGFLSTYAIYYLDYFIQDMFLVITVVFCGYSNWFMNDMKKVLEVNENKEAAVKELVRKYVKLQEKKEGFNCAFGALFNCFHFRNLFRCVFFVFGMVEKTNFWVLAFFSLGTIKTWIVYYMASKATRLNAEFRHLITRNLDTFIQTLGDTQVNFLLGDILVNPAGLGDGVSFVDSRFISELISMIATYVVILVTNKD